MFLRKNVSGKVLRFVKESPRLQFFDNFQAVGGQLWPAGDVLVDFLTSPLGKNIIHGRKVLELGAGCGYVGISCGVLGAAQVTMTDRLISMKNLSYDMEGCVIECNELQKPSSVLLDILWENIELNKTVTKGCSFAVEELHWGSEHINLLNHVLTISTRADKCDEDDSPEIFDVVIGSDLTYHKNISPQLFQTVHAVLSRSCDLTGRPPPKFIICHQHRLKNSTQIALDAAQNVGLERKELWTIDRDGNAFSIWEFSLR